MDITTYKKRRSTLELQEPRHRHLCHTCWQPDFSCYCAWIEPLDPGIDFIILIHPLEHKKRIATGRMAHLSLKNSRLFRGVDFSTHDEINRLLNDPGRHCVMLYPGPSSVNLTTMSHTERAKLVPPTKRLTIFVMDGTWHTAKKMVRLSHNLKSIPRLCFTPAVPSNFRIRQQPHAACYSTIEAIHQTIELFDPATRDHDRLLQLFEKMVNRQIELAHAKPA